MLTEDQIAERAPFLGASDVGCLMTGDEEKLYRLWSRLVGDPNYVADVLSHIWAVNLGSHTEPLNLRWYEYRTGRTLTRLGEVVLHPSIAWARCTLDGWDDFIPAPVEAKHVGGFEPRSRIIERYLPQTHWQMDITNTKQCILSIIEGAREPAIEVIEHNAAYSAELWDRAQAFMKCVESLTPPCAFKPAGVPVRAEKSYDLEGNNAWASEAVVWLESYRHAKRATGAEKAIKALVPRDAARCSGHGIIVTRDTRGYLSLREIKS